MRFKINLATKFYINTRRLKFYTAFVILLLVAMLFQNVKNIATGAGETKRLASEIAVLDDKTKIASKGVSEKEYHALLAKIAFANDVIERKSYNWLALLNILEMEVPDGVAISSVEPDTKNKGVKLPGIAKNFSNLRMFMERLEDSKFFSDVYLLSNSISNDGKSITFVLTCKVTDQ